MHVRQPLGGLARPAEVLAARRRLLVPHARAALPAVLAEVSVGGVLEDQTAAGVVRVDAVVGEEGGRAVRRS